jgi:hypothetical protein
MRGPRLHSAAAVAEVVRRHVLRGSPSSPKRLSVQARDERRSRATQRRDNAVSDLRPWDGAITPEPGSRVQFKRPLAPGFFPDLAHTLIEHPGKRTGSRQGSSKRGGSAPAGHPLLGWETAGGSGQVWFSKLARASHPRERERERERANPPPTREIASSVKKPQSPPDQGRLG